MNLSVVVPTRSKQDLLALSTTLSAPIYVVYDGHGSLPSFDGCCVLQGRKKGFAQACNVGLSRAQQDGYEWALILNDDAQIKEASIKRLMLHCSSETGAIGPLVYDSVGIESAGIDVRSYGRISLQQRIPDSFTEVDALAGVSLVVPTWVRFDKRFIHGFEDIALCFQLKKMGYQIVLEPTAKCIHQGGGSIPHGSKEWFSHSVYGQLLFYNRKNLFYPIVFLAFLQSMKMRKKDSFVGVLDGAKKWVYQRAKY